MLLQESDRFQHMSSVLLMSLLENSVHDFSLCHDGICMANQVGMHSDCKRIMHHGFLEESNWFLSSTTKKNKSTHQTTNFLKCNEIRW